MVRVEDCSIKLVPKTSFIVKNFMLHQNQKIALWAPVAVAKAHC